MPADPVMLQVIGLEGDVLHLLARYGGGCRQHDFHVCGRGPGEGEPATVKIQVSHDAHGDVCRAFVYKDLYIDLTPVRDEFREFYGVESGTVTLEIDPGDEVIEYRF